MEVKLGSVPVMIGLDSNHLLEIFQVLEVFQAEAPEPAPPHNPVAYVVRLQVRAEGGPSTWIPMVLTPGCARALAALLTLPLQIP